MGRYSVMDRVYSVKHDIIAFGWRVAAGCVAWLPDRPPSPPLELSRESRDHLVGRGTRPDHKPTVNGPATMIVDGGYVNLDLTITPQKPDERKKKCAGRKAQPTKPRKKNGRKMPREEEPMRDEEPCPKRRKLKDYISKIEAAPNREGILSVSGIPIGKNATEANITRAVQKLSMRVHPDKVPYPDLKQRATKAMAAVTLARRLLLNPKDDNGSGSDETSFECEKCGNEFDTLEECEEHEAQCPGYICGTCGDTFTVKTKYILHTRECKGKTKHQCMICCDLKSEKEMKLTQCCGQMKACNDCTDRAYGESNKCMWCRHFTCPTRSGKRKRE